MITVIHPFIHDIAFIYLAFVPHITHLGLPNAGCGVTALTATMHRKEYGSPCKVKVIFPD
jgi:hypothetical protein